MTPSHSTETKITPSEKTIRDILLSGGVGFFTGVGIGAPLSIGSYLLWRKIGLKGAARWWAWAATGLIGVPMSWMIVAASFTPSSTTRQISSSPQAPTSPSSPKSETAGSKTNDAKVGESSVTPSSTTRQTSPSQPQASASPSSPKSEIADKKNDDFKVGEFKTDSFQYTNLRITSHTIQNEYMAKQANVAGQLYSITADVTNLSKESKAPKLLSLDATDSQGRTFKEANWMLIADGLEKGQSATDFVLPGQTRKNIRLALIDASPDAKGFTFKVSGGMFNSQEVKPIE